MTTEHLIEKAHRAWRDASVRMPVGSADPRSLERGWIAAAIEAVESDIREEAHIPTNAEREALPINHCPEHGDLLNRPGDGADARSYRCRNAHDIDEIHAGLRRSEVPEPSAEESHLIDQAWSFRNQVSDSASPGSQVDLWLRTASALEARVKSPEPQGEPSDAQVRWERPEVVEAARLAYQEAYEADYDAEDCIVAALRAAGGVR